MLFMILLGLSLMPANLAAPTVPLNASPQSRDVAVAPALGGPLRKECAGPSARMADQKGQGPRARRLDELPQGRLEFAVFREVGGCPIPAVVHEQAGATPGRD